MARASAQSTGGGSYTATADTRFASVDLTTVPGVLFDQLVDAGVGVAQAQLDSLGQSAAYASTPYPSGSVVALPGLLAGLTGGKLPSLPGYPLIASSSDPLRPTASAGVGPLRLEAHSSSTASAGSATDGVSQATAAVGWDAGRQVATAHAEAALPSVTVVDGLSIFGLHAVADARQGPDGELHRSSSFELAGLEVLGVRVALTADQLSIGDRAVPLGPGLGGVLRPLLQRLAAQGTTVELVPATTTDDGVQSAGVRISRTVQLGPEAVVARVTLGAVAASVDNQAYADPPPPGPDVTSPPAPMPAASLSPLPLDGGDLLLPPPADAGSPAADPVHTTPVVSMDRGLAADVPITGLYPLLVLAGCLVVAVGRGFSRLGVRP
jgi:hypothetical protein